MNNNFMGYIMDKRFFLVLMVFSMLLLTCKKGSDKDKNSDSEEGFSNSLIFIGNSSKVFEVEGQLSENSLPNFNWFNEKDQRCNLMQYKGKPIVINFWATWCKPCKNELPEMVRIYNQYKDKGLIFLGVSVDQNITLEELAQFVAETQINYQIILDNGMLSSAFGDISAIPTTFFINKESKVVEKYTGAMDEVTLRSKVEKLF
jgi:thiol-disulfide isomerase/thioredoxin